MTAQFHETLILDGEKTSMAYCPPLPPESDERVRLKEGAKEDDWECTACWRGYIATWEIKNGKFYLNGFNKKYGLAGGEPILADWISETIRIPQGKMLEYVHMGYGSIYEKDLFITVENGVVKDRRVVDNRETFSKEMSEDERQEENMAKGFREAYNVGAWGGGRKVDID